MTPDFRFCTETFDGAIEHIDAECRVDNFIHDIANGQEMDLGFLELDDLAAGVSEIVELGVQRIRDRQNTIFNRLVVLVLNSERNQLRPDSAEFNRPLGHALRDLPHSGILKVASGNRPVDAGHDARFQIVMQNVAGREREATFARRRGLWIF